jgi:hypothetical protein
MALVFGSPEAQAIARADRIYNLRWQIYQLRSEIEHSGQSQAVRTAKEQQIAQLERAIQALEQNT